MKALDSMMKACNTAYSAETKDTVNAWKVFEKEVNSDCIFKVQEKISENVNSIPNNFGDGAGQV